MAKETTKETKPRRKTKLERTTEAQLFLEQSELQKQLEAEDHSTESTLSCAESALSCTESALSCAETPEPKPSEVHEPHIIRRLRKL